MDELYDISSRDFQPEDFIHISEIHLSEKFEWNDSEISVSD